MVVALRSVQVLAAVQLLPRAALDLRLPEQPRDAGERVRDSADLSQRREVRAALCDRVLRVRERWQACVRGVQRRDHA